MFKLNLETILAAFNAVEAKLEQFLKQNRIEIQQNVDQIVALNTTNDELEEQSAKATRVLARVKALTE